MRTRDVIAPAPSEARSRELSARSMTGRGSVSVARARMGRGKGNPFPFMAASAPLMVDRPQGQVVVPARWPGLFSLSLEVAALIGLVAAMASLEVDI